MDFKSYWWSPFSKEYLNSNSIAPYEEKDFGEVYWQGTYERSSFRFGDLLFRDSRRDIKNMIALLGRKPDQEEELQIIKLIENIVLNIAQDLSLGPLSIFFDEQRIQLNQSTVWRILKRRGARYTTEYRRWRKDPQYLLLRIPGEELQLDACFPLENGNLLYTMLLMIALGLSVQKRMLEQSVMILQLLL